LPICQDGSSTAQQEWLENPSPKDPSKLGGAALANGFSPKHLLDNNNPFNRTAQKGGSAIRRA
jgi:hypothetical protein